MTLHLLLPALILGFVGSQTVNMTKEELGKVERNQTLRESSDNSTVKPGNVTSSLNLDKSQIEDELQNNQTSLITEDDENFQDHQNKLPPRRCPHEHLVELSHLYCGDNFYKEMMSISPENWCVLENIIRPYNDMSQCLEKVSNAFGCFYPNPDIQDFFIQIHTHFFQNCSEAELVLEDAPHWVVIVLTLIPVSLIPVLVYLVVWKSNHHATKELTSRYENGNMLRNMCICLF